MDSNYKSIVRKIVSAYNENGPIWKQTIEFHSGYFHLEKRKSRNEIPKDWSLNDYNEFILSIMNNKENNVYVYILKHFTQDYIVFEDGNWMVIVGTNFVMETCMYRKDTSTYLKSDAGYIYIGKVKEVFEQ